MEWWTAISLGLISSFHCIGMCGPIAFALPLNRKNVMTKSMGALLYNLGRLTTYSILGALFGVVGKGLFTAGVQRGLSIGVGVVFLLSVLIPLLGKKGYNLESYVVQYIGGLKGALSKQFKKQSNGSLFIIGSLNGLLPCGMVYLALAGAIGSGSLIGGIEFMFLFGLGTLPLMYASSIMGDMISISFRKKVRKAVPVFVAIMGLLFILRGMNLNIPYVSPEINRVDTNISQCD